MSDPIEAFFTQLARRPPERLHRRTAGTIRFEVHGPGGVDIWHLTISGGRVTVSREAREADTVIHTDREFFTRMVRGDAKTLPAWLRNDIMVTGRFRLALLLERLFPPPPVARDPRDLARGRGEPR